MERLSRDRILDLLPLALGAWVVWLVLGTWFARLYYPFDLEWMEGGMLAHSWRLQQGLELYPAPEPDFIPFVYPPAYASIVAMLGWIFPLGYTLGRGVTCCGTLVAALAIVVGVDRNGGSAVVGCLAAAVFLGTYDDTGGFMDLVRPDTWHVALLAWSVVIGLEDRRGAPMASGLLLAASFLFKHNAAAYGFPILLGIALRSGWRQGAIFGVSAGLPAVGVTLYMQWVSEGRFLAYLLAVPGSHPMLWQRGWPSGFAEIGMALGLPMAACAAWLWLRTPSMSRVHLFVVVVIPGLLGVALAAYGYEMSAISGVKLQPEWARVGTFAALGVGIGCTGIIVSSWVWTRDVSWRLAYGVGIGFVGVLTAVLMRAHHGGFINVFLPVHWIIAFGVGIAMSRFRQERPGWISSAAVAAVFSAQLGYFATHFEPVKYIPTQEDVEAGEMVVALVAECEGPVHSPYAAWIPYQAGFEPSMHAIALWDVTHKEGPFREFVNPLHDAARDHHWGCVVDGGTRPLGLSIPKYYETKVRFRIAPNAMRPKTGWRARPTEILVPRE